MNCPVPAIPIDWVEKIFRKLSVTYGRDFLGRYEGIPLGDVKKDWSEELAGFIDHPEAIGHALTTLHSSKAPTVYEFRDACAKCPKMAALELPLPKQNPAIVAAIVGGIKGKAVATGFKDWACRLRDRHASGEKLSPYVIRCYREALGMGANA